MRSVDYSVYLVTDTPENYPAGLLPSVESALAGGVSVVQLRARNGTRREQYHSARQMRDLLHAHHVPFIINDSVDLALAVEADGIHVGQSDLPAEVVRKLIGPDKLVGLSITSPDQLAGGDVTCVDYLGVGPIFPTPSKADAAPHMGLAALAQVVSATTLPVVAIGGITLNNAQAIFGAGVAGVAVVSLFSRSSDPAAVARALRAART